MTQEELMKELSLALDLSRQGYEAQKTLNKENRREFFYLWATVAFFAVTQTFYHVF